MHNFMVEVCGSCLKQDVPLFDYMDENEQSYKHVKNSSIIRDLFSEDFNDELHNWKLCEDCSILLKGAVILKKGLLSSQLIYRSYLRKFNTNNHGCNSQFSNLSVQLQDIRIKYETVQEATEHITDIEDRCEKSEMQSDVENFVIDVLETKDIKIEIDETNYEEMLNNCQHGTKPTKNMKIKAENEIVLGSWLVETEQHKVSLLSYEAQKEGSNGVPCLKAETEMDTVTDCNDDTQTKAANSNCQNKSYKCIICNQKFAKKLLFLAHLRAHSDGKTYKCDFCSKAFSNKYSFLRHRLIHTSEKPYKCDLCRKAFLLKQNYDRHRQIHTGEKPYKCELCGKAFRLISIYNRHRRNVHRCETLRKCDFCATTFSRKADYDRHRRVHTGEKPYKCEFCAKAFAQKQNYNRHRRIHTGEKPYKCDLCRKEFSHKSACNSHRRTHTGEKPYKCDLCGKAFSLKQKCKEHSRTHTGEKPYKCDLCAKKYFTSSACNRHRRIHTG